MLRALLVAATCVTLSIAHASPPGMTDVDPSATRTERKFAAGYKRGTGLGNYGASAAIAVSPKLMAELGLFALYGDGERGFALAPTLQAFLWRGMYLSGGVQYLRQWFGDASGGGFGGFATFGYELKLDMGLSFQLGTGWHGRQSITAMDGIVTVKQRGNFGLHWDAGVRYWF